MTTTAPAAILSLAGGADSPETRAWIEAENALTQRHLEAIPQRAALRARLEQLWNYERHSSFERHGNLYAFSRNDGLQNQAVLYVSNRPGGEARVLLDPNTLSADGTVAFKGGEFSPDGKRSPTACPPAVPTGNSGACRWPAAPTRRTRSNGSVLATEMGEGRLRLTTAAMRSEGEHALKAVNRFQKLYFHRIGTAPADDSLV